MKTAKWALLCLLTVSIINYPNPFNPLGGQIATFECVSDAPAEASLYIYDMSARLVRQKAFNLQLSPNNRASWDGRSELNELVGNGVYLYRLVSNASKTTLAKGKIWVINR